MSKRSQLDSNAPKPKRSKKKIILDDDTDIVLVCHQIMKQRLHVLTFVFDFVIIVIESQEEEEVRTGDKGEMVDGDEGSDLEDIQTTMEITYYSAKGSINTDLNEAIEMFNLVLDMEEKKGNWGFKALKQITKAYFQYGKYNEMVEKYNELLSYMNAVGQNDSMKAINNILSLMSTSTDQKILSNIYQITLDALKEANNEVC